MPSRSRSKRPPSGSGACGDACQFECPGIDECRDAICPRHEQRFVPGECVYVELVEKALLVGPLPFDPSASLHPLAFGNGLCPVLDGRHRFSQRRNTEQAEGFCPATDTFQMLVGISEAGEYGPPGQIENLRIAAQVWLDAGFIADIDNRSQHCQSAGSPLVVVGGINRGVVNYQISSLTVFACVLRCQVRLNARGLIAAGRRSRQMESPNAADRNLCDTSLFSLLHVDDWWRLKITDPDGRLKADLAAELPAMGLSVRCRFVGSSQLGADPHRSFVLLQKQPGWRIGTDVCQSP